MGLNLLRCGTTWYPMLPYDLTLFDTFDKCGIMGFENNLLNFNVFKLLFALTSCTLSARFVDHLHRVYACNRKCKTLASPELLLSLCWAAPWRLVHRASPTDVARPVRNICGVSYRVARGVLHGNHRWQKHLIPSRNPAKLCPFVSRIVEKERRVWHLLWVIFVLSR